MGIFIMYNDSPRTHIYRYGIFDYVVKNARSFRSFLYTSHVQIQIQRHVVVCVQVENNVEKKMQKMNSNGGHR